MNGTAGGRKGKQKRENIGCPEPGNWGCSFGAREQAGHTPGVTFAVCLVLLVWAISSAILKRKKEAAGQQSIAG